MRVKIVYFAIMFIVVVSSGNSQNVLLDDISITSPFPYCQNDPNPIGGGNGYDNIILANNADILINQAISASNFKNIIENANPGEIIFIQSNITINLSSLGNQSINVPENITIASDRGFNGSMGALIITDQYENNWAIAKPLFSIRGNDVRLTGLRLQGPFQDIGDNQSPKVKICIRTENNKERLEVDNCVLFGWPSAAVSIGGYYPSVPNNVQYIHHNYFYNNRQDGLGYGVAVYADGAALIEANLFKANRHDIDGWGRGKCSYEASCNTVLGQGNGHNFDMHGPSDYNGTYPSNPGIYAGAFIYIHHNDFRDIGEDRLYPNNAHNILLRGKPSFQCRIENNKFKHLTPFDAIGRYTGENHNGNLIIWNNIYNINKYLGWYVKDEWLKNRTSNFINIPSTNDLLMTPTNGADYAYEFGDYDGDGETDIFKLENNKLYTTPLSTSIYDTIQNWRYLTDINHPTSELKFLFYDNDQFTDILHINNNILTLNSIDLLSGKIGENLWISLSPTQYNFSDFLFGDFDGNGISDLFVTDNGQWKVSYNCNSAWYNLQSANFSVDYLKLGMFNNNNKSDVFVANGTSFNVSYEGVQLWHQIATSSYTTPQLLVADFNGDNFSDIIHKTNGSLLLYPYSNWIEHNTTNFPLNSFTFGNF